MNFLYNLSILMIIVGIAIVVLSIILRYCNKKEIENKSYKLSNQEKEPCKILPEAGKDLSVKISHPMFILGGIAILDERAPFCDCVYGYLKKRGITEWFWVPDIEEYNIFNIKTKE